ncbi:hypothetical protein COO60DRAFT_1633629 [Scenedesmus sp. NREL 46B-D3]|nr:hypothetical protein COO60DRAFT_1633629 [Scenedesmus sp. NREL 46B-D3]
MPSLGQQGARVAAVAGAGAGSSAAQPGAPSATRVHSARMRSAVAASGAAKPQVAPTAGSNSSSTSRGALRGGVPVGNDLPGGNGTAMLGAVTARGAAIAQQAAAAAASAAGQAAAVQHVCVPLNSWLALTPDCKRACTGHAHAACEDQLGSKAERQHERKRTWPPCVTDGDFVAELVVTQARPKLVALGSRQLAMQALTAEPTTLAAGALALALYECRGRWEPGPHQSWGPELARLQRQPLPRTGAGAAGATIRPDPAGRSAAAVKGVSVRVGWRNRTAQQLLLLLLPTGQCSSKSAAGVLAA